MALPQVYRLQFQYRVQDQLCSWGIHYECTAGTDPIDDASDLAAGFGAANGGNILSCLATDVTAEGIYVSAELPAQAMPARVNLRSVSGGDSGESAPANLCTVLTLQTADPTAVRQGRTYFSGISKSRLTSGIWSAAFLAGPLTTLATSLAVNVIEGAKTFRPVFLQKVINGSPVGPNIMPLSAIRITQIPYTQRRRTTRQLASGS